MVDFWEELSAILQREQRLQTAMINRKDLMTVVVITAFTIHVPVIHP